MLCLMTLYLPLEIKSAKIKVLGLVSFGLCPTEENQKSISGHSSVLKGALMRKIDKKTGEISDIKVKGLWAPFPIPAYQVLARQRDWKAQKLLTCLVSFLGSDGYCVYPSYDKISERCGLGRNSIRKALDSLEKNGFIVIYYFREGKKERNKYYLQDCCWDSGKMNEFASRFRTPQFKCLDCGELIDRGGYGEGLKANKVHWGCGGPVISLKARERALAI